MNRKTRVLIADDHLIVRMGLSAIIDMEKDLAVVGEACDGREAVRLAAELKPDVIVMDLMMPEMDGANAIAEILAADPSAKVLVLTTFGTSDELRRALDNGAVSALIKDSEHAELLAAIRATAASIRTVSPVIERQLKSSPPATKLTARQTEILGYIAQGLNNTEIAAKLGIGRDCVKAHLKTAFALLNVSSRSEAVAIALRKNLLRSCPNIS